MNKHQQEELHQLSMEEPLFKESPFGGLCCKECGKLLTIAMAEDHKCRPKMPSGKRVGVSKEDFWG